MALSQHTGTYIQGIVNVAPSAVEDNLELELLSVEERQALVNHTGIHYRRIADQDADIKDYFEHAVEILLQKMEWDRNSVDVLICVTQAPKMLIPSVSNRLHGDLNLSTSCVAFDVNSGCSGFVYGLNVAQSLLQTMISKNARAILCCGDLSTQLINPNDRSVRPIFSDAVSAIAIEKIDSDNTITGYFNCETFGKGQTAIEMQPNASMTLNGIDVFGFSVKYAPANMLKTLEFAQKEVDFVDGYFLHQANRLINESIRKKIEVDAHKFYYSLEEYGNTASASIPVTIGRHYQQMKSQTGWIMLCGFGVGFSVASAIIKFNPQFVTDVIGFDGNSAQ